MKSRSCPAVDVTWTLKFYGLRWNRIRHFRHTLSDIACPIGSIEFQNWQNRRLGHPYGQARSPKGGMRVFDRHEFTAFGTLKVEEFPVTGRVVSCISDSCSNIRDNSQRTKQALTISPVTIDVGVVRGAPPST